ncbi:hypothetical protein [Micromonospora sp. RP3T]|uniref:hypothetical protein n=1 Tax=Micromonospora sp. RP3T TaxID=2135446 RepID=UPI000D16B8DC|nr:hypothetical protein [Micromonospora sp. RP3T]PTA43969.1 hypothetical protein C8054_22725 [Micromonospora sp. RP3T]
MSVKKKAAAVAVAGVAMAGVIVGPAGPASAAAGSCTWSNVNGANFYTTVASGGTAMYRVYFNGIYSYNGFRTSFDNPYATSIYTSPRATITVQVVDYTAGANTQTICGSSF